MREKEYIIQLATAAEKDQNALLYALTNLGNFLYMDIDDKEFYLIDPLNRCKKEGFIIAPPKICECEYDDCIEIANKE